MWTDSAGQRQSRMTTLVDHYSDVQEYVRNLLGFITDLDLSAREAVGQEIADALGKTKFGAGLLFKQGRLSYVYDVQSVYIACVFAFALLLDERRGLQMRLKRCGWCGRFNLDLNPKGRPHRFCSTDHKREFDLRESARRVREWRKARQRR